MAGRAEMTFQFECSSSTNQRSLCLKIDQWDRPEIVNVYPSLNPPTLTARQSTRICNALSLLQRIASHPETTSDLLHLLSHFLDAFVSTQMLFFLFPFLHTTNQTIPFEFLRLSSLGVIGALVKGNARSVFNFLIGTEVIPLCLHIMDFDCELSKTVATFILQMILLDNLGLPYVCQTYERFAQVAMTLEKMVLTLSKEPSPRHFTLVLRCYMRLSDNPRARQVLRQCLPQQLMDNTFTTLLKGDMTSKRVLAKLKKNLREGVVTDSYGIPLPGQ